jgi:hypothetical protein
MGTGYVGAPLLRPPIVRLSRVCHIGTLDPAEKGAFSWEAHALSVSRHPEEWEAIGRLGGRPWHLLERAGGAFLDYWALREKSRLRVALWGLGRGLVERRFLHARRCWDSELEDTLTTHHATRAEALAQADGDSEQKIRRVVAYLATETLEKRIAMKPPELDAFDALLLCFVEDEHRDLDGVWWADRHGPLSAPRGAIVPARLARWTRRPLDPSDAERLLLGG